MKTPTVLLGLRLMSTTILLLLSLHCGLKSYKDFCLLAQLNGADVLDLGELLMLSEARRVKVIMALSSTKQNINPPRESSHLAAHIPDEILAFPWHRFPTWYSTPSTQFTWNFATLCISYWKLLPEISRLKPRDKDLRYPQCLESSSLTSSMCSSSIFRF